VRLQIPDKYPQVAGTTPLSAGCRRSLIRSLESMLYPIFILQYPAQIFQKRKSIQRGMAVIPFQNADSYCSNAGICRNSNLKIIFITFRQSSCLAGRIQKNINRLPGAPLFRVRRGPAV